MHDQDVELMFKYARELTYAELEKEAFWGETTGAARGLWRAAKDISRGGWQTPVGTAVDAVKTRVGEGIRLGKREAQAAQQSAAARVRASVAGRQQPQATPQGVSLLAGKPASGKATKRPKKPSSQPSQEESIFDKGTGVEVNGSPVTWGHVAGAGVLGTTGLGSAYVLNRAANTLPSEYPQEKAAAELRVTHQSTAQKKGDQMYGSDTELMFKYARQLIYTEFAKWAAAAAQEEDSDVAMIGGGALGAAGMMVGTGVGGAVQRNVQAPHAIRTLDKQFGTQADFDAILADHRTRHPHTPVTVVQTRSDLQGAAVPAGGVDFARRVRGAGHIPGTQFRAASIPRGHAAVQARSADVLAHELTHTRQPFALHLASNIGRGLTPAAATLGAMYSGATGDDTGNYIAAATALPTLGIEAHANIGAYNQVKRVLGAQAARKALPRLATAYGTYLANAAIPVAAAFGAGHLARAAVAPASSAT